jgi:hypothetical protein
MQEITAAYEKILSRNESSGEWDEEAEYDFCSFDDFIREMCASLPRPCTEASPPIPMVCLSRSPLCAVRRSFRSMRKARRNYEEWLVQEQRRQLDEDRERRREEVERAAADRRERAATATAAVRAAMESADLDMLRRSLNANDGFVASALAADARKMRDRLSRDAKKAAKENAAAPPTKSPEAAARKLEKKQRQKEKKAAAAAMATTAPDL